jgi:hypothetical protein
MNCKYLLLLREWMILTTLTQIKKGKVLRVADPRRISHVFTFQESLLRIGRGFFPHEWLTMRKRREKITDYKGDRHIII